MSIQTDTNIAGIKVKHVENVHIEKRKDTDAKTKELWYNFIGGMIFGTIYLIINPTIAFNNIVLIPIIQSIIYITIKIILNKG